MSSSSVIERSPVFQPIISQITECFVRAHYTETESHQPYCLQKVDVDKWIRSVIYFCVCAVKRKFVRISELENYLIWASRNVTAIQYVIGRTCSTHGATLYSPPYTPE